MFVSFDVGRSTFDLPAIPLGGLVRMSSCLGPVTMIIPPSFVMHGRRVFDVHLLSYGNPRGIYVFPAVGDQDLIVNCLTPCIFEFLPVTVHGFKG